MPIAITTVEGQEARKCEWKPASLIDPFAALSNLVPVMCFLHWSLHCAQNLLTLTAGQTSKGIQWQHKNMATKDPKMIGLYLNIDFCLCLPPLIEFQMKKWYSNFVELMELFCSFRWSGNHMLVGSLQQSSYTWSSCHQLEKNSSVSFS